MKTVSEAKNLSGKFALVRIDTNVPLEGKKVADDSRLRQVVPTLRFLERKGAHIILVGHLGRPKSAKEISLSLKPIGYHLGKLLKKPVKVVELSRGVKDIRRMALDGPVLLENIRFEKGEEENSLSLSKQLAALAHLFVNEAFSVSHRKAASLVGVAKLLPAYAGFQLVTEVDALTVVQKRGKKPVVAVVGGAKVGDKLPVIARLLSRLSAVLVGGAVANTFLAAKGYPLAKSLVDRAEVAEAKRILKKAKQKLVLPVDVIADRTTTKRAEATWRRVDEVKAKDRVVDLGTETTRLYATYIKQAQTVFWSGPLGLVENPMWSHATLALGRLTAARARGRAYVIVGGGDTVSFFHKHDLQVDYVSLAGSAMLDFLAGDKLPGLTALGYRG